MTESDADVNEIGVSPGQCTEFHMTGYEPGVGENPMFDVDVTFNTETRDGMLTVFIGLQQEDCEDLWEHITGGSGHSYPDDVRERVLEALEFPV